MKKGKTLVSIIVSLVLGIGLLVGFTYGAVKFLKLPVDLPMMPQVVVADSNIESVQPIIDSWKDIKVYEVVEVIPEITPEPVKEEITTKFDKFIDKETLEIYIDGHLDCIANGEDYLFIDEVTVENIGVGIKTILGDDVLALDNKRGILIIGSELTNGSKVKTILIDKEANFGLEVVDNLTYWVEIAKESEKNGVMLSFNASDYVWNDTYKHGRLLGLVKRNGDVIRKTTNNNLVVGITGSNQLIIGEPDAIETGIDATKILIKDSEIVAESVENEKIQAKTALGALEDGTLIAVIIDGSNELGGTTSDVIDILNKYEVTNAAMLSCGSRTIMYFNNRLAVGTTDEHGDGLKLPNTWSVK